MYLLIYKLLHDLFCSVSLLSKLPEEKLTKMVDVLQEVFEFILILLHDLPRDMCICVCLLKRNMLVCTWFIGYFLKEIYDEGTVLIREGESGNTFFIIIEGMVSVLLYIYP